VLAGAGSAPAMRARTVAAAVAIVVVCSTITTLMVPSAIIVDVVALYLILGLLAATYLPLVLLSYLIPSWRKARAQAGTSPTALRL
jgi:hypothetical protein